MTRARSALTWVLTLLVAVLGLTVVHAERARAGSDDYPADLKAAAKDSKVDPWRFYNRECTSFVAWRLNEDGYAFQNFTGGQQYGDATHWGTAARALGIPVDGTPAVGSVAWTQAGQGHVAWVEAVNGDGTVTLEEYNDQVVGGYDERIAPVTDNQYIHFHDLGPSFTDGTFLHDTDDQSLWLVAGGAPTLVTSWAPFGGAQPTTDVTGAQLALMPTAVKDDTFLTGAGRGDLWRVAGDSAIAAPDWSAFGGPQPSVAVDPWVLDHPGAAGSRLLVTPKDGTPLAGMPSQARFVVRKGRLAPAPAGTAAVPVADAGLARLPAVLTTVAAPVHVVVGQAAPVTLVGTGFLPGTAVAAARADVRLAATTVLDSTHVTTAVTTTKVTSLGPEDLTVTGPDGASAVCKRCLVVDPIPVAATTHTATLLVFPGDLQRRAVLRLTGKGVTVLRRTSLGHGHFRLTVLVQKGTAQALRNLRVMVDGVAVRTLVHVARL